MTERQWRRIETLFEAALDVPRDEREQYLALHSDDPAVRKEVASLLATREEAPGFFSEMADRVVVPLLSEFSRIPSEEPNTGDMLDPSGQRIGPYRLAEEIGVGGMGIVYRAERVLGDFEQTVAIKLLQRRLQTEEGKQRFRAERQVLSSLDHPNIAALIDGGVTEGGRPYLVMEHVDGQPITQYVEAQELDLEARLDLLRQTLEAVSAAHGQLVVHRDLKPSNVLVTETESGPKVTLLDFGIAKLLDDSLPVTRPQTRTGQHLLTPPYAAPEQVKGEEVAIMTDVYQLGVLAYELLAGTRPFHPSGKSLTEIERLLIEEMPPAPSDQVRDGTGVVPGRLRGDLDMIVMKALRKEPGRRYRSAEALAADLRRYRSGEPIQARPATVTYRARKFITRNRTAVGAGLVIAALGVAYVITVTIQANRLAEQRNRARTEAETARQVSGILVDLFQNSNPYENADTLSPQVFLRRGEQRLTRLQNRPAVRARLLGAMGQAHHGIGNYNHADSLLQRAFSLRDRLYEDPHSELARSLHTLGLVQHEQRRYTAAESLHTEALALRRQMYESPHRRIAESLHHQAAALQEQEDYAQADSLYRLALSMRRSVFEAPHPKIAQTLNDLGLTLEEWGRYAAADSLQRLALSMRRSVFEPPHPKIAATLNDLGIVLKEQKQHSAADSVYRDALSIKRKTLPSPHPAIAITLYNMAINREEQGNDAAADTLFQQALAIERKALGSEHPSTAVTIENLAEIKERRGHFSQAETLYREVLSIRRKSFGPRDSRTAESIEDLAGVLRRQKQYTAAESAYRRALEVQRNQVGQQTPEVATTLNNLGLVMKEQGELRAADSLYRKSLSIKREVLPPSERRTTFHNRAHVLMLQERYAMADSLFRRALSMRRAEDGKRSMKVAQTQAGRARLALRRENYHEAERLARTALDIRQNHLRDDHPLVRESLRDLVKIYGKWSRPKELTDIRHRLAVLGD